MIDKETLEVLYLLPIGIIETDYNGKVVQLNPYSTNLIMLMQSNQAYESDINCFSIFSRFDKDFGYLLERGLASKDPVIFKNHDIIINENGIRKIRMQCRKLLTESLIFVIEDITSMVESEEKRKNIEDELNSQQKNLAKIGQAIRSVVHDLRNPIGVIQSFDQIIDDMDLEEVRDFYHTSIMDVLKHINSMVNELLDFTKAELPDKEYVKVSDFVNYLKIAFSNSITNNGVDIKYDVDEDAIIYIDEKKLTRVFENISRNAAKAMIESGISNPEIIISIYNIGDSTEMFISDNGPGIPNDLIDKLFDPFAYKSKLVGNGIGLSIVKKFVDMHKGTITVDSNSQGTTFYISLPSCE